MPKLDVAAIETYAKAYAAQLCKEQYAHRDRIDGDTLLRLSPVSQVNLFVIRDLYDVWKETATAFRSPYFNFESEEVKKALQSFLNTVSKHISVQQKDLEPLLAKATHESLEFLLAPQEYLEGWLRELPDFRLTAENLKAFQKYNRLHKGVISGLSERLGNDSAVYTARAIEWVQELTADASRLDSIPATLDLFASTLPVDEQSLYEKEIPAESDQSFFDQVEVTTAGSSPSRDEYYVATSGISRTESSPDSIASSISTTSAPETALPAPDYAAIPTAPAITPAEDVTASVNDQFSMQPTMLNEKLKEEKPAETLGSQYQHRPISSIHSFISLNHKFIFINQLFKGDATAYHQAIDELEKAQSFDQAKDLMNRVYAPQYKWRDVADEADDFYEIVRRKFN
ncbi:hypothetical protein [Siphonobacter sp. SORGH_AS_0500]|uniref:hypothetical protein n=1 Tax=Siphonobacter sp. SORGH_AS_0500 TaxID=1864824 RepID=UPI00285CC108|nr:hypothetical protein [Siphonobacter sp. SORGH_AS_0500]MDR6193731.1 hypothetical protein [Siphonobacter sp. SORGH_AS_0500]